MKARSATTYEVRVYMGSINEETKKKFSKKTIIESVGKFQDKQKQIIPVRMTKTIFVCGEDYSEKGWELAVINYPRTETESRHLDSFMLSLAEYILHEFKQNRVSVVMPLETVMFERNNESKRFKWGRDKLAAIGLFGSKQ